MKLDIRGRRGSIIACAAVLAACSDASELSEAAGQGDEGSMSEEVAEELSAGAAATNECQGGPHVTAIPAVDPTHSWLRFQSEPDNPIVEMKTTLHTPASCGQVCSPRERTSNPSTTAFCSRC
jgi:hypothetical protein